MLFRDRLVPVVFAPVCYPAQEAAEPLALGLALDGPATLAQSLYRAREFSLIAGFHGIPIAAKLRWKIAKNTVESGHFLPGISLQYSCFSPAIQR